MINLKLILYGIAVAVVLSAGIFVRHIYNEAQKVPALEQLADEQNKQINDLYASAREALERENDIQKKLAGAYAGNDDLARRLRLAYAAKLPKTSPFTTEPVGTPGAGSGDPPAPTGDNELDSAVSGVLAACKRDSIRLNEFQRYYESVPAELK